MSRSPTLSRTASAVTRALKHLPGIGPGRELTLRAEGAGDWLTLRSEARRFFKGRKLDALLRSLDWCLDRWEAQDYRYFAGILHSSERWRLTDVFHPDVTYFDIEATGGGSPPETTSTAICFLHQGTLLQEYDYGRKRLLLERIQDEAKLLCTYNGLSYDVPFLREEFGFALDAPHVDLCPWLRRQGFKGGLKAIQHSQTHLRQRLYPDVNGYDAVRLWRLHEQDVPDALDALLTYNAEDVLILPGLLVDAYGRELAADPAPGLRPLTEDRLPELETRVSARIYRLLRARTSEEIRQAVDFLSL